MGSHKWVVCSFLDQEEEEQGKIDAQHSSSSSRAPSSADTLESSSGEEIDVKAAMEQLGAEEVIKATRKRMYGKKFLGMFGRSSAIIESQVTLAWSSYFTPDVATAVKPAELKVSPDWQAFS